LGWTKDADGVQSGSLHVEPYGGAMRYRIGAQVYYETDTGHISEGVVTDVFPEYIYIKWHHRMRTRSHKYMMSEISLHGIIISCTTELDEDMV
jgi:hypothetical protein